MYPGTKWGDAERPGGFLDGWRDPRGALIEEIQVLITRLESIIGLEKESLPSTGTQEAKLGDILGPTLAVKAKETLKEDLSRLEKGSGDERVASLDAVQHAAEYSIAIFGELSPELANSVALHELLLSLHLNDLPKTITIEEAELKAAESLRNKLFAMLAPLEKRAEKIKALETDDGGVRHMPVLPGLIKELREQYSHIATGLFLIWRGSDDAAGYVDFLREAVKDGSEVREALRRAQRLITEQKS